MSPITSSLVVIAASIILLAACTNTEPRSARSAGSGTTSSIDTAAAHRAAPPEEHLRLDGGANGCMHVSSISSPPFPFYIGDSASMNYLVMTIDPDTKSLAEQPQTFDLAKGIPGVTVVLDRFDKSSSPPYCSDYNGHARPAPWNAIGGTITIRESRNRFITTTMRNLRFRSPDGSRTVVIDSVSADSVFVGGSVG